MIIRKLAALFSGSRFARTSDGSAPRSRRRGTRKSAEDAFEAQRYGMILDITKALMESSTDILSRGYDDPHSGERNLCAHLDFSQVFILRGAEKALFAELLSLSDAVIFTSTDENIRFTFSANGVDCAGSGD